jgi:hypothetical protein
MPHPLRVYPPGLRTQVRLLSLVKRPEEQNEYLLFGTDVLRNIDLGSQPRLRLCLPR